MLASLLLVCAPPLLVVLLDLALPPMLLSAHLQAGAEPPYRSFVPAMLDQARTFEFRSSLVDLPAVFVARALLIDLALPPMLLSAHLQAGPELMMLLSLSLAAAHVAVVYRTSCRERRRLLVYLLGDLGAQRRRLAPGDGELEVALERLREHQRLDSIGIGCVR